MRVVLVCGGRTYRDGKRVFAVLDKLHAHDSIGHLLEGGQSGADELARTWATCRNVRVTTYEADWGRYRASAGPRRNERMIVLGKPDLVVAFPGGNGTRDCVERATAHKIPVIEVPIAASDHAD